MPAPTHDQLKALIQQETDMFDALVQASNDAYIIHRAWRELIIENQRLKEEIYGWQRLADGIGNAMRPSGNGTFSNGADVGVHQ